jgi:hypothetical protein
MALKQAAAKTNAAAADLKNPVAETISTLENIRALIAARS